MTYDSTNLFAKILREELPCDKIAENDFALAFYDIAPRAPVHILVIPKQAYRNSADFFENAGDQELCEFYRFVNNLIDLLDIKTKGYRLVSNDGIDAGQQVDHFHIHILAGCALGAMVEIDR